MAGNCVMCAGDRPKGKDNQEADGFDAPRRLMAMMASGLQKRDLSDVWMLWRNASGFEAVATRKLQLGGDVQPMETGQGGAF